MVQNLWMWLIGRTFCAEEFARDVECFTSDNDNLLTVQKLFRDNRCKTSEQVTLAVDDNL